MNYTVYPMNKRPVLTSASNHHIISKGHGYVGCENNIGNVENFHSKVTPDIKHNILSPAMHL